MTETTDSRWSRALILAVAAVAVIGGSVYLVNSLQRPGSQKTARGSSSKRSNKKIKAEAAAADSENDKAATPTDASKAATTTTAAAAAADQDVEVPEDLSTLTADEREALSARCKERGNKLFSQKKYDEAIKFYTQAIELKPNAIFYANRAACEAHLGRNEDVIKDCTEALKLDPRYIKAFHRRATASISLNLLDEALKDYTAICMLEEFKKEASIKSTDDILKEIGKAKAADMMLKKKPRLPSETFISAYLDSFVATTTMAKKVETLTATTEAETQLKNAFQKVLQRNWTRAMELASAALQDSVSLGTEFVALAENLNGTFSFLCGEVPRAMKHFETALSLNPRDSNARIKLASIQLEKGDVEAAMSQYEKALESDDKDPDVYYHRGQVHFLTNDLQAAIDDYKKSLELCQGNFVYAHIQLGVALYKNEDTSGSKKAFETAKKKFPRSPEVHNYHGEIYLDQQQFAEALEQFDAAIALNPGSPLPHINKSILYLQGIKDHAKAEEECRKAAEVDPQCDIAFVQLAQLMIHQNKLQEALDCYDKAIEVCRSEAELVNAISCREAAGAQLYVSQLFPDLYAKLRAGSGL